MSNGDVTSETTAGIPNSVIVQIEQRYWEPIRTAALPERFVTDPTLLEDPSRHPALFSDHGVTHVRDIARNTDALARLPQGSLISARTSDRTEFVRVVAVLLAYLHDIGMVAPTLPGRRVHPQFAAQVALGAAFDDIADELWACNVGGTATRLSALHASIGFRAAPERVFREVLAMALCHSKSAIPSPLLDDRGPLRERMQRRSFTPLDVQIERLGAPADVHTNWPSGPLTDAAGQYGSVVDDAFEWLVNPAAEIIEFADDVIDAVRLLRAGDALRQRGTALCTSGGSEICVDPSNSHAVYTLHSDDRSRAVILSVDNIISAAESNVAYADLLPGGVLRMGFNRGFDDPDVRQRMVVASADLIDDIDADAAGSFLLDQAPAIELVRMADDPDGFVEAVVHASNSGHRRLAGRVQAVASDEVPPPASDLAWAAGAEPVDATSDLFVQLIARMAERGLQTSGLDPAAASAGVVLAHVAAGTVVLQTGTASPVVVVPTAHGLSAHPDNGLETIDLHQWLPVGATGVVRGGRRNASVVAECDLDVVVIPAAVYREHWFRPYSIEQMVEIVSAW